MLSLGAKLYTQLPELYKRDDATYEYALKRFLEGVLGKGLDDIETEIDKLNSMYNLSLTDDMFIDHLAAMMGIKFHYTINYATRRKLLGSMPHIIKTAGTKAAFEYLARELYGDLATITVAKSVYEEGMTPDEYRALLFTVSVEEGALDLATCEDQYRYMAEQFRPVNTSLTMVFASFMEDIYNALNLSDSAPEDTIYFLMRTNGKRITNNLSAFTFAG